MKKTDLLSRLGHYLRSIASSGEFDEYFSKAINENYKNIVYQAIRTSKQLKEDPDDIIQIVVIGLWEALEGFCKDHFVCDGTIYKLHNKTDKGWYMTHKNKSYLFEADLLSPMNYPYYQAVFFRKLNQLCSRHATFASRQKRGLNEDHVYLQDSYCNEDGAYSYEEVTNSCVDSPEEILEFEELKGIIYEDLSDYAKIYFDAVSFMPPGSIEGWSKPLKLYVREVQHARAELYRTYNSKLKGFNPVVETDEIMDGLKDPSGMVEHRSAYVSAGVLKR